MVLGDDVSTLETFVWILNHVSRSITWFLFALKALNLVKWLILTWSFIWWGQFIDWLQFETRPSSPLNFGMAYSEVCAILAKETSDPFTNMMVRSTDRGNCTNYNFEHTDTKYKDWIILPCYRLCHNRCGITYNTARWFNLCISYRCARNCNWYNCPCLFSTSTFQKFSTVDREVSPTSRSLLSLPGLRPGFQAEILWWDGCF